MVANKVSQPPRGDRRLLRRYKVTLSSHATKRARRKMMRRLTMIAAWTAALAAAVPVSGAGLRTPFGEVVVRNLKIGQTYSLYKLVNLPLRVVNTGDAPVELLVDVIPVSTDSLRAGYERAGEGWVKAETG